MISVRCASIHIFSTCRGGLVLGSYMNSNVQYSSMRIKVVLSGPQMQIIQQWFNATGQVIQVGIVKERGNNRGREVLLGHGRGNIHQLSPTFPPCLCIYILLIHIEHSHFYVCFNIMLLLGSSHPIWSLNSLFLQGTKEQIQSLPPFKSFSLLVLVPKSSVSSQCLVPGETFIIFSTGPYIQTGNCKFLSG